MLRLTLQDLNKLCVCFSRLFFVSFKKILTVEILKWWKCTSCISSSATLATLSLVLSFYATQANHAVKLKTADCPVVPKGCQLWHLSRWSRIIDIVDMIHGCQLHQQNTSPWFVSFTHCHVMCSYANNNEKDRGKIWGDEGIPYVALLYNFKNRKLNYHAAKLFHAHAHLRLTVCSTVLIVWIGNNIFSCAICYPCLWQDGVTRRAL